MQGAVQENQLEQEMSQTPVQNDPNWPTDFSNSAKKTATQGTGAELVQPETPAQPSAAASIGSALVKTVGAVMAARSSNNMYGSPMGGGSGFGSTLGRMMGGNSYNPMMGGMGNPMMGGMGNPMMGGMGNPMMGGMGSPYGYNNSGGMMNSLMNSLIRR